MWPYVLGAGVVSLYYRIYGIIFERTTEVGEILVAEGDQIEILPSFFLGAGFFLHNPSPQSTLGNGPR